MPKQNISQLVSGMGVATSLITSLMKEVQKRGGTDEDIHRLVTPEGEAVLGKVAELIVATGIPKATATAFTVTMDYTKTVEQMVEAGTYDWKNKDINSENFPVNRRESGKVEVHLIHFNRFISSDDATKELDRMGFRPAELPELLALGAKQPDEQRKYPIVVLGSAWQHPLGFRLVPALWHGGHERDLDLCWFGDEWRESFRFAAVRK